MYLTRVVAVVAVLALTTSRARHDGRVTVKTGLTVGLLNTCI